MQAVHIRFKLQTAAARISWALARLDDAKAEKGRKQRDWIDATQVEIHHALLALDRAVNLLNIERGRSKEREEGKE